MDTLRAKFAAAQAKADAKNKETAATRDGVLQRATRLRKENRAIESGMEEARAKADAAMNAAQAALALGVASASASSGGVTVADAGAPTSHVASPVVKAASKP